MQFELCPLSLSCTWKMLPDQEEANEWADIIVSQWHCLDWQTLDFQDLHVFKVSVKARLHESHFDLKAHVGLLRMCQTAFEEI